MYHKLSVVQKKKEVIQNYMDGILNPLDTFQTQNYKFLVTQRNHDVTQLLEQEYDLYLKKLEVFYLLVDEEKKKPS